jgi:hypothetical protein
MGKIEETKPSSTKKDFIPFKWEKLGLFLCIILRYGACEASY